MKLHEIYEYLASFAPISYAMEYDNVGLLLGSMSDDIESVLVSLDASDAAVDEAIVGGFTLLLTHHPLIFGDGLKKIVDTSSSSAHVLHAARAGISVVSMHTNLDAAHGGVNDALATALGLFDVREFKNCDARDNVPSIGRVGRIKRQTLEDFASYAGKLLGCDAVSFASASGFVEKVAVGGGSCVDYMDDAAAAGCDTLLTSDVRYKFYKSARAAGVNLIDCGHYCTENVVVALLAKKLAETFPTLHVKISAANVNVMRSVWTGRSAQNQ